MSKSILYVLLSLAVIAILAFVVRTYNPTKEINTSTPVADDSLNQTELAVTDYVVEKSRVLVDGEYLASSVSSSLVWEGRKTLVVDYKDQGTINLQSGFMRVEAGTLSAGEIILDMTSLKTTSVGKGGTEGLDSHLKSADFFDVENFSEAKINLLGVNPVLENNDTGTKYNLQTEITIKDVTNSVVIPAEIYMEGEQLVVVGRVDLDRTLWNIRYGSDKFFDNLANNVIDDFFTVDFRFVAQK